MQFPKLHYGHGIFDLEKSKVKKFFTDFGHNDLRHAKKKISSGDFLTAIVTTMYADARCAIYPCFLGSNQIAILKIAIVNAGLLLDIAFPEIFRCICMILGLFDR